MTTIVDAPLASMRISRVRFLRSVDLPGLPPRTVDQLVPGEHEVALDFAEDRAGNEIGIAIHRGGEIEIVPLAICLVRLGPQRPALAQAIDKLAAAVARENGGRIPTFAEARSDLAIDAGAPRPMATSVLDTKIPQAPVPEDAPRAGLDGDRGTADDPPKLAQRPAQPKKGGRR